MERVKICADEVVKIGECSLNIYEGSNLAPLSDFIFQSIPRTKRNRKALDSVRVANVSWNNHELSFHKANFFIIESGYIDKIS